MLSFHESNKAEKNEIQMCNESKCALFRLLRENKILRKTAKRQIVIERSI